MISTPSANGAGQSQRPGPGGATKIGGDRPVASESHGARRARDRPAAAERPDVAGSARSTSASRGGSETRAPSPSVAGAHAEDGPAGGDLLQGLERRGAVTDGWRVRTLVDAGGQSDPPGTGAAAPSVIQASRKRNCESGTRRSEAGVFPARTMQAAAPGDGVTRGDADPEHRQARRRAVLHHVPRASLVSADRPAPTR